MGYDESNVTRVLRSVFGYENFKNAVQKEATIAISEGSECVCISMPPGFGRSLCFQLPAVLQKGKVSVVFSPKLSFMENHVDFLRSKQINARLLSEATYANERKAILRDLTSNSPTIVLLYTTPKVAMFGYFQKLILSLKKRTILSYIVFDEAQCLSKWGYKYVPCYKQINSFDTIYGHVPRIAVTTTVTDKVIEDICKLLTLKAPRIFKIPVQQISVQYDVWFLDTLSCPYEHLKSFIIRVLGSLDLSVHKIHKGLAIVYCREEVTAELIKDKLSAFGIPSLMYHHKLNTTTRRNIENKWTSGEACVIITTYNYGFIHKKPIRCVVYWTVPENIAKYYRESARTHMDNGHAYCRIYFSTKEYSSMKVVIENHRIMKDLEHDKNQLNEFNKLVSYCLLIKCRHVAISEYFGHAIQECKTNCDVCENKEIVEIRTLKFITYSESIGVKYNICDMNEDLKQEQTTEDNKERSEEIVETKSSKFKVVLKGNEPDKNNRIVQCNKLARGKQKPSSNESSSLAARLCTKDCVQTTAGDTVKCAKDNSNAIRASELAITQSLMDKYNLNKGAISLERCGTKNNASNNSIQRISSTRVSSKGSESKNELRIGDVNSDGGMQEVEKKDRISRSDSCEVIVIAEAKEQSKKRRKRPVAVDTCSDEFKSKRRKLGTENKPTGVTRIKRDRGTSDRDERVERIKDDANESVSRDHATMEYLMNKYKLNNGSITLELRRK